MPGDRIIGRGNYRGEKETRARARSLARAGRLVFAGCARARARARARSTFSVIFHVPLRRLSPRWIAEMEFAPRYFTSCHGALAAHGRHVPINIEDCNPEGRGIDLNFALCTKARSTAARDLKLRIDSVRARLLISRGDTSFDRLAWLDESSRAREREPGALFLSVSSCSI